MEKIIEYKDFQIRINEVPKDQFDYPGFGWAYQIDKSSITKFSLVVKAPFGRSENNIDFLYNWGFTKVKLFIDNGDYEIGKTYCFSWSEVSPTINPEEVDCDGFLYERL